MSKIVTITLNPSIDKSSSVPSLIPDQKLRCKETKYEPGGGGVNISRAIKKLGGESTAYFLSGGHFGDLFIDLLKLKEISFQASPIKNETRESLILLDESNANQYLLSMEGVVNSYINKTITKQTINHETSFSFLEGALALNSTYSSSSCKAKTGNSGYKAISLVTLSCINAFQNPLLWVEIATMS